MNNMRMSMRDASAALRNARRRERVGDLDGVQRELDAVIRTASVARRYAATAQLGAARRMHSSGGKTGCVLDDNEQLLREEIVGGAM